MENEKKILGDVTIVICPDQDTDHPTEKLPRVGGVQQATETMRLPPSPRPGGAAEDTELYIIGPKSVRTELIDPTCRHLVLGASPHTDIPIPDKNLDARQLAIARTEHGWLFADRGESDGCTFDGVPSVQWITPIVSRTVIGIGDNWAIFFGACATATHTRLQHPPVRDADAASPHVEATFANGSNAGSWGSPILVGSHARCDLILGPRTPNVTAFHGVILWTAQGIRYQPLGIGFSSVEITPDSEGHCTIDDRGIAIQVTFIGNLKQRQAALEKKSCGEWSQFVLTGIDGVAPAIMIDRRGHATTLGRGACDARLPDRSISRVHAVLHPEGKHLRIIDCNSSNGSHINGSRIKNPAGSNAYPGDLIDFGKFHYRLEYAR